MTVNELKVRLGFFHWMRHPVFRSHRPVHFEPLVNAGCIDLKTRLRLIGPNTVLSVLLVPLTSSFLDFSDDGSIVPVDFIPIIVVIPNWGYWFGPSDLLLRLTAAANLRHWGSPVRQMGVYVADLREDAQLGDQQR